MAAAPGVASAQDPSAGVAPPMVSVRLEFVLEPGADLCPGEAILHREFARRIGYDPFEPSPQRTPAGSLTVHIAGSHGGLKGTYYYIDAAGKPKWPAPKTYTEQGTGTGACTSVMQGIAVELAWEFTLLKLPDPTPPAQPAPGPLPPPAPAVPTAPPTPQELPPPDPLPPPPPPKVPVVPRLGISVWGEYATIPTLAPGFTVTAGLRYGVFSGALQGRWDPPVSFSFGSGNNERLALLSGGVLVCGHVNVVVPCIVGEVSQVQLVGSNAAVPTTASLARGMFGVRVGEELRLPFWRHVFLEPGIELLRAFGPNLVTSAGVQPIPRFNLGVRVGLLIEWGSP
jgi:hypothetical protein